MTDPASSNSTPTLKDIIASYGEVDKLSLSRIQKFTAKAMVQSWTTIPHVTHNDRMDLTDVEDSRKRENAQRDSDERLTPVPYLFKAVAGVMQKMPKFNSVLDVENGCLLQRHYFNIGMAIDTPSGLVVGVIKDCDKLSVDEISAETKALGQRAKEKGLTLSQMSGGGFTISSLGALGGDGFSPIINAPEVAILGVGRLQDAACRGENDELVWRSHLPVSLSYDHRVINGADAGRFMAALQEELNLLV